jgi:hypothetical protein
MPDPVGSPGAPHSAAEVAKSTPYSDWFFLDQQDTSSQSADYVVPNRIVAPACPEHDRRRMRRRNVAWGSFRVATGAN